MVLAHSAVLEAPAFAVVVDELSRFARKEQGLLVVLLAEGLMSKTLAASSTDTREAWMDLQRLQHPAEAGYRN